MTARSRTERPSRSTAEWVSFGLASVVLLAIATTIAVLGARGSRQPHLTTTVVGQPRTTGGQTYVTAEVHNTGTAAATEVQVVAELPQGGQPTTVGEQVVSFLAGGASSTVVFVLGEADVSDLTVRVQSYADPR